MSTTNPTHDADIWDAQFTGDLAVLLRRYLQEHPAPPSSCLARDAEAWAANLQHSAELHRLALGQRPLRAL